MTIQFKGYDYPFLVVFDLEHDSGSILQLAALLFEKQERDLYRLKRNYNIYVWQKSIAPFIADYTKITQSFLNIFGVEMELARAQFDLFLEGVHESEVCFVSHDIQQDWRLLKANNFVSGEERRACTFKLAQKVLERDKCLRLEDIAIESAFGIFDKHNAYTDAWATVASLSYLLYLQEQKEREDNEIVINS